MNSQGELAFCGGRSLTPHNANGAVMFETSRASEAEFAARSEQAAKVAEALAGAGFAVRRDVDRATEFLRSPGPQVPPATAPN